MTAKQVMRTRGFTVIELLMVIVILGILSVVAVSRFENLPGTRAQFALEKVRSDVRYAQMLAIQTQRRTRFSGNVAADTYALEIETAPNVWNAVTHPVDKNVFSVTLNTGDYAGVDITDTADGQFPGTSLTVIFDAYGAPFWGDGAPLTEPAFLELNNQYRIHFRAETGKVDLTGVP